MGHNYRFLIQPLNRGDSRFQLRVGMLDDRDAELVPAHRTAFAGRLHLEIAHPTVSDAQFELTGLLEWIETPRPGRDPQEPTRMRS